MSMDNLKINTMRHHHRHYLLYVQLLLLTGLLLLGAGRNDLSRLKQALPFAVSLILLFITVRLCVGIIRMVDPELASKRSQYMHGSTLPVLVYAPQN
jgi:hypothetical protein